MRSPPGAVDDAPLAAFVVAERGTRLRAAVDGRARKVAAAWNACVRRGLARPLAERRVGQTRAEIVQLNSHDGASA